MIYVAKIGLPILCIGLGGGMTFGATKQSSNVAETNTDQSNLVVTTLEQGTENVHTTAQAPEIIQETPSISTNEQPSQDIPPDTEQLRQEITVPVTTKGTEGNCEIVTDFQAVINALSLGDSYVAITCNSKGIDSEDDELLAEKWEEGKWIGLFSKDLFEEDGNQLIQGYKLDIKTKTDYQDEEDAEELYKTIFQSDSFSSSDHQMIGKWNDGDGRYDDKLVDFIKTEGLEVKKNIYFVHI